MQIDRLFMIVQILVNKGTTTAKELAERFEVSTRTIYRDIDTLSLNGVPVYTVKGKGGGIHILDDYVMDKSVLSETEQNSLIMGLEALKATSADSVDETLLKIKGIFNRQNANLIKVDFAGWNTRDEEKRTFELIKQALTSQRIIELDYYNARGIKSHRKVMPQQLVFKIRHWYLAAYCLKKQGHRLFKVSRIRNLDLLNDTFDSNDYPPEEQVETSNVQQYFIKCRFLIDKSLTTRVYDEFVPEAIEQLVSGDYEVTYVCPEDEWLYSFILSYGHRLRVLEPESLAELIKERVRLLYINMFEED